MAIDDLIAIRSETVAGFESIPHPRIPLPRDLYRASGYERDNSMGTNLANDDEMRTLAEQVNAAARNDWRATPLVPGASVSSADIAVSNPADRRQVIGNWQAADSATVERALANAVAAQPGWYGTPSASRAAS